MEIPSFGNNFKFQASQVVYAGGAIKHGVSLAKTGTEMARFQADKNRGEVRFLIAGDYIELCKLGNQLCVLDSNLVLARRLADKMQARADNGTALQTDVNRLHLMAENLEYTRLQVESAREIVGKELANALGMGKAIPVVNNDLPETAIGDAVYSTALTGLMNLRPDLELAIRELYGYSVIFGVGVLILIALSRFKRQIYNTVPLLESFLMAAVRNWNITAFRKNRARSIP